MRKHSRRTFMMIGLGFLAGCASGHKDDRIVGTGTRDPLPDPYRPQPRPRIHRPTDPTWGGGRLTTSTTATFPGVRPRNAWSTGSPIAGRMNRMTPITRITVHHDGMTPFFNSDDRSTISRIDAIRSAHQNMGWGDIGYHFVVDRSGRVWEGRPISYQGAHVKDFNEGNIGVMCLGNFDRQEPSELQLRALQDHLSRLTMQFRVPVRYVHTHQELRPTACPGRSLQRYMVNIRNNGGLA